jgi:hypothetical protein
MTARERLGTRTFVVAMLVPFLAIAVKPSDYSFWMGVPAVPLRAFDRARLACANGLLAGAFGLAAASALVLFAGGRRRGRRAGLVAPLLVVLHPLFQPVVFERLDASLAERWRARTEGGAVAGKKPSDVEKALGRPSRRRSDGPRVEWDYSFLPFYWLGRRGRVVFVGDRAQSIRVADD